MQCLRNAYVLFIPASTSNKLNTVGMVRNWSKHANIDRELINMLCIELDSRMLGIKLIVKHTCPAARAHLLTWYARVDKNLTPGDPPRELVT